jgi:diamine N-acetyltransferase
MMSYPSVWFVEKKKKDADELQKDLDALEFQLFRMQENLKEVAKKYQVLGIDQDKHENWVVVYGKDDGNICRIMVTDSETPYQGTWDFSLHAQYEDKYTIHIDDIRGPVNKGYGSICMNYLKEIATNQNIHTITGEIAKRDWDHIDRLVHFYEKHHFHVELDEKNQCGEIIWNNE